MSEFAEYMVGDKEALYQYAEQSSVRNGEGRVVVPKGEGRESGTEWDDTCASLKDKAERPHGTWARYDAVTCRCSVCGHLSSRGTDPVRHALRMDGSMRWKFCPACGAMMDGVKEGPQP